jgi:hypothetical protein
MLLTGDFERSPYITDCPATLSFPHPWGEGAPRAIFEAFYLDLRSWIVKLESASKEKSFSKS